MGLPLVPDTGVFTKRNQKIINDNFTALTQPDIWVRPQYGNNNNVGSYDKPFATMSGASRAIVPGIVIGLEGVLREEFAGPIVNDVTIVGMANQPRQATTSGVPNGGGATWLSPSTGATTHLLIVKGQGWTLDNLFFNNSTAGQACVQALISGGGDPPADPAGEQLTLQNCVLTGAKYGLLATGGPNFLKIVGNTFFGFSDSGDTAIVTVTGAGVHTNSYWIIKGNDFLANAIHIDVASFGVEIAENHFSYVRNGVTTTTQLDLTGSDNASVHHNMFDVPFNQNGLSAMFVAGTSDRYGPNALGTACLTPMTGFVWGKPVSGAA